MKRTRMTMLALALLGAGAAKAEAAPPFEPGAFELGVSALYTGQLGASVSVSLPHLVANPLGLRAGLDYFVAAPIAPAFARTLQQAGYGGQSGHNLVVGLDALASLMGNNGGPQARLYAGGRYNLFSVSLVSEGDRIEWSSAQFGLGGGVMAALPLSATTSLTADVGLDRYFPAAITERNSNGDRDTYAPSDPDYQDTRANLRLPGTLVHLRLGIALRF